MALEATRPGQRVGPADREGAARGTHDDLMRARGQYYEMVVRQMESHSETVEGAWR